MGIYPCLLLVGGASGWYASSSGMQRGGRRHVPPQLVANMEVTSDPKASLKEGLRREYASFFQPMEDGLYDPSVTFTDPLISFSGVDAYRNNVNMLAGANPVGKLLFSDCGLIMHNISETADGGLESRWTLQFRFNLLPWKPIARFTGVSRYTLDARCRITSQRDYWDSVNMRSGGRYEPAPKLDALKDFLGQLAPSGIGDAQRASSKELPYVLLRRAAPRDGNPGYEVRRYPQHVSIGTEYYRRLDAFGTLGAYTGGANELNSEVPPYVPSLMSVPWDKRTMEQIRDDSLDLKPAKQSKMMRWPMAVPAMQEGAPPKPAARLEDITKLEMMPSKDVAVLAFSDPTTEFVVRGFDAQLRKMLREDGLVPASTSAEGGDASEQFRLAQFDALNSFGARRSEIWIDLDSEANPW